MCPICISSMALAVTGATSAGAVSTFVARSFARIPRGNKTQPSASKETIRHDHEPDRAPQGRLAR
jgi:hypothetical protein